MRRFLCFIAVACSIGFAAVASTAATAATPSGRSCRYVTPRNTFPDVQRLAISNSACLTADRVAGSIQHYWRAHSAQPAGQSFPRRPDGFTCAYVLRHEPTGDPYYTATCQRAGVRAGMDLTS